MLLYKDLLNDPIGNLQRVSKDPAQRRRLWMGLPRVNLSPRLDSLVTMEICAATEPNSVAGRRKQS